MRKILVLYFGIFLLYTCSTLVRKVFTPPTVRIEKIHLQDISFNGVTLLVDISVENPNKVGISLKHLKYKITVNEEPLLNGLRDEKTQIEPQKRKTYTFPFMVYYRGLKEGVSAVLKKSSIPYRFEGNLALETPIGVLDFDLNQEGKIPIPKLPSVEIEKVRVDEMSLSKASLSFDVLVKNNEDISLDIKQIRYRIALQGEEVAKLESDIEKNINGIKDFRLKIPVELRFLNLRRGILDAIKSGKLHYQVDFHLRLDSQYGPYELPFEREALVSLY